MVSALRLLSLVLLVALPAAAQEEVHVPSDPAPDTSDPTVGTPEAVPAPEAAPEVVEDIHESAEDVRLARRLGYRVGVDGPVTFAAWTFWIGTEALKPEFASEQCRWCEPTAVDWATRNALVWQNTSSARHMSDVLLFGVAPAAALGTTLALSGVDGRLEEAPWDGLLILEAVGAAAVLTQTMKLFVARERPFVHVLPEDQKRLVDHDPFDNNMSFFSGHSSVTFALASATATVARMRGRRYAVWAWVVGMPIAAATAYLRIAGDKHYLSDVAVGALAGTAMGVLVPAVHDWTAFRTAGASRARRRGLPAVTTSASIIPLPGGAAGSFAVRW